MTSKKKRRINKKHLAMLLLPIIVVIAALLCLIHFSTQDKTAAPEDSASKSRTASTGQMASEAVDGLDFLGQNKSVTDAIFGQPQMLYKENAQYYPLAGVSVIFDEETELINYIDCDNTGNAGSIEIMGISIGWSEAELMDYLSSWGYTDAVIVDGSVSVPVTYNDQNIEVDVLVEDDLVALISAYLD